MNVIPKIGIGAVRFGMSPAEVRAHFSEEQKYEEWMGGNLNDSLLYHGIIFKFDGCDGGGPDADSHLDEVEIFGRQGVSLWGQDIGDWSKNAITTLLKESGIAYEISESGDILAHTLSLQLLFKDNDQLERVYIWSELETTCSLIFGK